MKTVRVLRPFDGHEAGAIVRIDHARAREVIRRGLAEQPLTMPVATPQLSEQRPQPRPAAAKRKPAPARKRKAAPAKKAAAKKGK